MTAALDCALERNIEAGSNLEPDGVDDLAEDEQGKNPESAEEGGEEEFQPGPHSAMKGGVTWSQNRLADWPVGTKVRQSAPELLAATLTDDFCCERLQQWDEDPIEEKQTELERQ